jgi:hypothetical protein
MSLDWNAARDKVPAAARALFAADPNVFSVGLGRIRNRPVWRVSRARPADGALLAPWKQSEHDGLEVRWTDFDRPAEFEHADPALMNGAMSVPPRLLACGAELQNFDLDHRNGVGRSLLMNIGTLGCFVTLQPQGHLALLSCAHVLSQGNRGQRGDAVYSGGSCFQKGDLHVGAYEPRHRHPQASFSAKSPDIDSAEWNEVDAAVALLLDHVVPEQSVQIAPGVAVRLQSVQSAQLGDHVVLCGRTFPHAQGIVDDVATVVRLRGSRPGEGFWFRRGLTVKPLNGNAPFSQPGDSGAVIVREHDGAVVGLHFAGNGALSFANDMDSVMTALSCRLA